MDVPPSGRRSDLQARGYEAASAQTMDPGDTIALRFVSPLDTRSGRAPYFGHLPARGIDEHRRHALVRAELVSYVVRDDPEPLRGNATPEEADLVAVRLEVDVRTCDCKSVDLVDSLPPLRSEMHEREPDHYQS